MGVLHLGLRRTHVYFNHNSENNHPKQGLKQTEASLGKQTTQLVGAKVLGRARKDRLSVSFLGTLGVVSMFSEGMECQGHPGGVQRSSAERMPTVFLLPHHPACYLFSPKRRPEAFNIMFFFKNLATHENLRCPPPSRQTEAASLRCRKSFGSKYQLVVLKLSKGQELLL